MNVRSITAAVLLAVWLPNSIILPILYDGNVESKDRDGNGMVKFL